MSCRSTCYDVFVFGLASSRLMIQILPHRLIGQLNVEGLVLLRWNGPIHIPA